MRIEAQDLRHVYDGRQGLGRVQVTAIDGVDLRIEPKEIVAIIGESGAGKSTLARILAGLERPTSGQIRWDDVDVLALSRSAWSRLRIRVQMVHQHPESAMNPRMTIRQIMQEPFLCRGQEVTVTPKEGLNAVGLNETLLSRNPHELSGGQKQRVVLARALAVSPEVMICDEILSALDVSVAGQIIETLEGLQRERSLSIVWVSHDLRWVRRFAHRVGVMTKGRMVEVGPVAQIFESPEHPYTRALMAAVKSQYRSA